MGEVHGLTTLVDQAVQTQLVAVLREHEVGLRRQAERLQYIGLQSINQSFPPHGIPVR